MEDLVQLLLADHERMKAMECARSLALPDCYVAAGFVRNLVWDHLHHKPQPTPLNDLDIVYFDPNETDDKAAFIYEAQLAAMMPELNWQVRNQACLLYTSPSPRDRQKSRMPSSA